MRAELGAVGLAERLLQQRAENRGLDLAPVMLGRGEQFADLLPPERKHLRLVEELAVEFLHLGADRGREQALIHGLPHLGDQRHEARGIGEAIAQQRLEAVLGNELDILGEHREQAAHQEQRYLLGVVLGFQRLRHRRQPLRDLARDAGGMACRIERFGRIPDRPDPLAHRLVAQIVEIDAEPLAVGELNVVFPLSGEVGIELETVSDIADDQEGRPAMRRRQCFGVVLGLAPRMQHHHVPGAVCAAPAARGGDGRPPRTARSAPAGFPSRRLSAGSAWPPERTCSCDRGRCGRLMSPHRDREI